LPGHLRTFMARYGLRHGLKEPNWSISAPPPPPSVNLVFIDGYSPRVYASSYWHSSVCHHYCPTHHTSTPRKPERDWFKLSFKIVSNSQRKIKMMFTSLPLYIVTALFAIGCVAGIVIPIFDLTVINRHFIRSNWGISRCVACLLPCNRPLFQVVIQFFPFSGFLSALPSVPQQDPGVLENIEETVGKLSHWNFCQPSVSSKLWSCTPFQIVAVIALLCSTARNALTNAGILMGIKY